MVQTILTDELWKKIQPLLPPESGYWGRPSKSHRIVLEGILWIFRTGAPWRDLPPEYGPWSSCYNRFNRWTAKRIWERVWDALKDEIDHENYAIDGSNIKAHQDACRVKKRKGMFRSFKRWNNNEDSCINRWTWVEVLLNGHTCENVLADKAYDSDAIRNYIEAMGANPVIPGKKNRVEKSTMISTFIKSDILLKIFSNLSNVSDA